MTNYDIEKRNLVERELLSAMMTFKGRNERNETMKQWVMKTHGIDSPNFFSSKLHQAIFTAIMSCWKAGIDSDPLSVMVYRPPEYKDRDNYENYKGFDIAVVTAQHTYYSIHHFDQKMFILKQYILIDFWTNLSSRIKSASWDIRDVVMVGDNYIQEYKQLLDKFTVEYRKGDVNLSVKERAKKERAEIKSGKQIAVPTGIPDYDRRRKGWRNGELTIIAARPSMGKTAIMVACAWYAVKHFGISVHFFSLEVDKKQILNHIIAAESGLNYDDIKNHNLSDSEFEIVLGWYDYLETCPLTVFDLNSARTMQDVYDQVHANKPQCVFVDYLQLVKTDASIRKNNSSREQEVSEISRTLKLIAVEFGLPVIAGAQLSRKVDERLNHRPVLSDLRESGSIEQDADNVLFPFRQAYYDEAKNPGIDIPVWRKGNFELHQAKGRDSGTGHFNFNLHLQTYKFHDGHIETEPEPTG